MATNNDFLIALGKRIDQLRKEKNLSFQELADLSEMEKSSLVKLTSQGNNITVNTLYNISRGLGISMKDLFDF